jgi:hypothetical protein
MWSSTFFHGSGRPSFNTLQNYGSSSAPIFYYVFDVLVLAGRNVMETVRKSWTPKRNLSVKTGTW